MSLLQDIKKDQVAARKAKDAVKTKLLTTLLAEASAPGFNDGKRESTNPEVIAVCKKFIKNIDETLKVKYSDELHAEKCIVAEYLPKQFTEDELRDIAEGFFKVHPEANMGQVMGWFKKTHDGQYDGKTLSGVIKGLLNA